jgi:hypothetical protein
MDRACAPKREESLTMQIRDDGVFFGIAIPLERFAQLASAHYETVPGTAELEVLGKDLIGGGIPEAGVGAFVRRVCVWGGYAGVWGRVLKANTPGAIREAFTEAVTHLAGPAPDPGAALRAVNRLKGLGQLSFASKHLRFLWPELCPVFDSYLQAALPYSVDPAGYARFAADCRHLANELTRRQTPNPWPRRDGRWFAADVEAAIFMHVGTLQPED